MDQGRSNPNSRAAGRSVRRWLPLALVAVAALAVWLSGATEVLSLRTVAENRQMLSAYVGDNLALALLAYAAVYAAVVALSLPGGAILTVLGGFLFGALAGGAVTVVAATAGATAIFLIARSALGETLAARAGPGLEKLRAGFDRDALSYLLFLRLVPAFPFWLVNLAAALLGMRLGPYVIGTFVGIIPGTLAFAFAGAGLDSLVAAQQQAFEACQAGRPDGAAPCEFALDAGSLLTPQIVTAFVALGIVALLPIAVRRLRAGGAAGMDRG